jgi:Tfp pilus assembly protein PilO
MAGTNVLHRVLKEERRPLLALAIALVVNLAIYGLAVRPMSHRVDAADARAAAAEQARRAAASEFSSIRAVADGKQQAEGELQTFYEKVLPGTLSAAQRATYLSLAQLARDTNLRLSRRVVDAEHERRESLDRLAINIALEGDYQDVRQFIYRLETGPSFVVIDHLTLEQGPTTGDVLRLSLELSTYYRANADGD